jgi:hypothetical protein
VVGDTVCLVFISPHYIALRFARKHDERLHHHANVEAIQLLDNSELLRRLNRTTPFELAN